MGPVLRDCWLLRASSPELGVRSDDVSCGHQLGTMSAMKHSFPFTLRVASLTAKVVMSTLCSVRIFSKCMVKKTVRCEVSKTVSLVLGGAL